ncbi:MAG: DNA polymerase III subunit delta [Firmicutes bacterium]|nr:DNA polymerase III subunit delta [Bacillota bacterium]
MEFIKLKATLKEEIAPVYVLFGSDNFLINKSIELVTNALGTLDITKFDEKASMSEIMSVTQTISMFGDKRLVIMRGAEDKHLKELKKYLEDPSPDCVLILVLSSEKAPVAKNVQPVDCNPIKGDILLKLIAKQFGDNGKKITPSAASLIAKYCADNYAKIDNEIGKLVNFFSAIDIIDVIHVEEIVSKDEEFQTYELGSAICTRNLEKAQGILARLKSGGVDDYAIFGNLVSMLKRLYYSLATNCPNEKVASALKANPYAIMYARRDNKRLAPRLSEIYKYALNLEYKIKSGQLSIPSAIDLIMMEVGS